MTDLAPVAVVFHSVRIRFDTPGVTTGVRIWTPSVAQEVIMSTGFVSIITPWNSGGTATLHLFAEGDDPATTVFENVNAKVANTTKGTHAKLATSSSFPTAPVLMIDMTPVVVCVDDGAGGATGATAGELFVVIAVCAAYLPGVSPTSSPIQA